MKKLNLKERYTHSIRIKLLYVGTEKNLKVVDSDSNGEKFIYKKYRNLNYGGVIWEI